MEGREAAVLGATHVPSAHSQDGTPMNTTRVMLFPRLMSYSFGQSGHAKPN